MDTSKETNSNDLTSKLISCKWCHQDSPNEICVYCHYLNRELRKINSLNDDIQKMYESIKNNNNNNKSKSESNSQDPDKIQKINSLQQKIKFQLSRLTYYE